MKILRGWLSGWNLKRAKTVPKNFYGTDSKMERRARLQWSPTPVYGVVSVSGLCACGPSNHSYKSISRKSFSFDLIFSIIDKPNRTRDTDLATHILRTHKAGEMNENIIKSKMSKLSKKERDSLMEIVMPTFDPEFLRKYIE